MEQQKVTINELVKRLTDEMLRIGYSKQTIYRNFIPNMMHVVHFYEATGTVYYSPASSAEYLSYNIERCKRGEITDHYVRQIKSTISKMDEFFTTGTLRIRSNKHGTTYIISAENERLIDQFIGWKNYGPMVMWWTQRTKESYWLILIQHLLSNEFLNYRNRATAFIRLREPCARMVF